jgi:uncharacterized protein (TIGR03067 family)
MRQARIVVLCVVAGVLAPPFLLPLHAQEGQPQTDRERLQGDWQVVSVEWVLLIGEKFNPMGQPTQFRAESRVRGEDRARYEKWMFKAKEVVIQDLLMTQTEEYRLDADQVPKTIDFFESYENTVTKKPEPRSARLGIYRLDGDTLTVCVNEYRTFLGEAPRSARPGAFQAKTDENASYVLYRLKRARPVEKPAPPRPVTPPEGDAVAIAKNPKLLALAKERHAAALQEVEGRLHNISIGRAVADALLVDSYRRLLRASLDLAKSREEQEQALQEHWARLYATEDVQEKKYLVGKEDITGLAPIRFARLDAEMRLEMFRQKRTAPK